MAIFGQIEQWVRELELPVSTIDQTGRTISIDIVIGHTPTLAFIHLRDSDYVFFLIDTGLMFHGSPILMERLLELNRKCRLGSFCVFKDKLIVFKHSVSLRNVNLTKEKLMNYLYLLRAELARLYSELTRLYRDALDTLRSIDLEEIKN